MTDIQLEKRNAARASLQYVENNMVLGLGSGSTSGLMVRHLGELVAAGLVVQAVPSSEKTAELARAYNIPLTTLAEVKRLDLYIDGADEIDPEFNMIKGGGGALLREKILAYNSEKIIIIIDSSKQVKRLGAFKLPVEVIPFAYKAIMLRLDKMHLKPMLRLENNEPYKTDENNYLVDIDIGDSIDYGVLNHTLLAIPGIVETGLFFNYVDLLIVGKNAKVETLKTGRIASK